MPKTDIKLYASDGTTGNKTTATISYVNPEASNSVLKTMAQKLNALTTNVYISTDRVETIEVDTDTSRKVFRNITLDGASKGATATITLNKGTSDTINPAVFVWANNQALSLTVTAASSSDPTVGKYTVQIPSNAESYYIGIKETDAAYSEYIAGDLS